MTAHRPHRSSAAPTADSPRPVPRTGLAGRDFLLLLAATTAVFGNSAPLLSVVPLWADRGGSGHGGAGATTAVTMATTVLAQLAMGRVLRRFGARRALTAGALLMGVPAFGYALSAALPFVLAVSAVRGLGFGMVTVAGSALVAALVPAVQRGRAVGWYGVAVGLPAVAVLPLAVWAATTFGFVPVFLVTAALGVLSAPLSAAIGHRDGHEEGKRDGERAADAGRSSRVRVLLTPWTLLFGCACALGSLMSFLPLALTAPSAAPAALFTLSLALIAGRWAAGEWSDRRGAVGRLTAPAALLCALGTAAFAGTTGSTAGAVGAALLFGLGVGAVQNDTLVTLFHRAPGQAGTVSAVWNMGYDAGFGVGALATGAMAQALSLTLPATFLVLAAALAAALLATTAAGSATRARSAARATSATRAPAGHPARGTGAARTAAGPTAHEAARHPPETGEPGAESESEGESEGGGGAGARASREG